MAVQKPSSPVEDIRNQLRTLDSKINLLAEKLKTLESNQEIAGRTLLAVREQVRSGAGGKSSALDTAQSEGLGELKSDVKALAQQIEEMKYVLDAINPLNYATIDQVKELLDDKLKAKK